MMIQVEFVSHVEEGFILIGIIHPMINTNLDNLTGHLVKGEKNLRDNNGEIGFV